MSRELIAVKDMSIGYKDRTLYSGITFEINEGDCIMLCGANGSGKTTLLKALKCRCGSDAVMIPSRIPKIEGFTLREFIIIGCYNQSDMGGRLPSGKKQAIDRALTTLGLEHLSDRDISTLSDGEFQKAGIASALVMDASIILLDEPTAFLDAENRISILNTLRTLCMNEGKAVIFSTHDLHDGAAASTRIFALGADGIFRHGTTDFKALTDSIFSSLKPEQ